jgi:hypothetical protein
MGEDFARELYVARLKGVYIVENVPCRAGRPVIRTF